MHALSYEVILWDWNGTLLSDSEFCSTIINGMLRRRGLPERSLEEHARLFDFPVIVYYERVGFDLDNEPFEVASQEFIDAYYSGVQDCSLKPGSNEVLGSLKQAGYRQLILSASHQDHLENQVTHYGLRTHFEELLGIDTVHAPGKTGRGREWIEEVAIDPARVLLVGDTVHDSEVAEKMGIECWLVAGGHHPLCRLEETGRRIFENILAVRAELLGPVSLGTET
jgi:phosphoglycolate phosphatase